MNPETPTKAQLVSRITRLALANRRLREMIIYALDGPDDDCTLPNFPHGRAIDCCKKILRDALAESEAAG